ncbi:hypothetical protein BGZ79_010372 [Entomortierella chlamydospora]|nr:hypothetical protein BGZ79_010372 [Entomortierella chlamydospora]
MNIEPLRTPFPSILPQGATEDRASNERGSQANFHTWSPGSADFSIVGDVPADRQDPLPKSGTQKRSETVTDTELSLIARVFNFFEEAPEDVCAKEWWKSLGKRPRDRLSRVTGIGTRTCDRAIHLADSGSLKKSATMKTGRPKKPMDKTVEDTINQVVSETNKQGIPNSSRLLSNEFRKEHNILCSPRTVRRDLRKLEMFWGKGIRQNIQHDAPQNVAYRNKYLLERLKNLRWVKSGGVVREPGRKPLLVIFAAFVVWYDEGRSELRSSFVNNSVHIWPAIGKAHTKQASNRKSAYDAAMWNDVPEEIRNAGIVADLSEDYHDNFNGELFDKLFEKLCDNLANMGLRGCNIHLDGASYHFHKKHQRPDPKKSKVADLREWLTSNGYDLPPAARGEGFQPNGKELMSRIKTILSELDYSIYSIAAEHGGHRICKTPPYHYELQPIEKIWAVVKNAVAAQATGNMKALQLKQTLIGYFFEIPMFIFISLWNKNIEISKAYIEAGHEAQEDVDCGQWCELEEGDVGEAYEIQYPTNDIWLRYLREVEVVDMLNALTLKSVDVGEDFDGAQLVEDEEDEEEDSTSIAGYVVPALASLKVVEMVDSVQQEVESVTAKIDYSLEYINAQLSKVQASSSGDLTNTNGPQAAVTQQDLKNYLNNVEGLEGSEFAAAEFYDAITKARGVLELSVKLDWVKHYTDFVNLKDMIPTSNIRSIKVDLTSRTDRKLDFNIREHKRYDPLVEIMRLPSIQSFEVLNVYPDFFKNIQLAPFVIANKYGIVTGVVCGIQNQLDSDYFGLEVQLDRIQRS